MPIVYKRIPNFATIALARYMYLCKKDRYLLCMVDDKLIFTCVATWLEASVIIISIKFL